ncbi:paraquat-inducible protein A [Seohaeicola saemankumensis]|nr:paraquat-inducible protein A [Seohaeicola saemankumensis]MCA0869417.1 paraquat-inducible protein A [Seohaeicola saemankumensis]
MENAGRPQEFLTARRAGLVGCRHCGVAHPAGTMHCSRCGSALASRDTRSLQHVWAWLVAGMIAFVPANIYPMLLTTTFGKTTENTIVGGAIDLLLHGEVAIAGIVFFASVVIPIGKFLAIGYLALSVRRPTAIRGHSRQRLYEVVEFIGRWSMIDVFVVAILTALVQLNFVAAINPGIAAICFALSVAFTMVSALSFDPKTLWDAYETDTA